MTRDQEARRVMSPRPSNYIVADTLDVEVGVASEHHRNVMGNRRLTATHRVNGHERQRVVESAHVATPCSLRMSFS